MPDFNAWTGSAFALSAWRDDIDHAYDTAQVIAEQSVSIVVVRGGTNQAAQTVRLEPLSSTAAKNLGAAAETADLQLLIIGYKSHPTIADTNIRRGDRFYYDGYWYDVRNVINDVPDRLLAVAEVSRK